MRDLLLSRRISHNGAKEVAGRQDDVRSDESGTSGARCRFRASSSMTLRGRVARRSAGDLVFTGGAVMRSQTFQRAALTEAAESLGIPGFQPHELRHTAASLAIASGANVKVVQQMLGHKSATMTLDQYGHLFGDRLDVVADAMDAAAPQRSTSALAECVKNVSGAEVIQLR
jgi:hypothetical protein